MEEFIKKEDGFTAWRAKLNRVYGTLSWLLAGTKEKSVLSSENGNVEWMPVKEAPEEKKSGDEPVSSFAVDGILSALSLAVTGAAKFFCRIDADAGIAASAVSVRDALVLQDNGKTAVIRLANGFINLGNVFIGDKEAYLPSRTAIGDAGIGYDRGILSFYGKTSPLKLNLSVGWAEMPYGLGCKEIAFPNNGRIDGSSYTGCASSALRLNSSVEIFGRSFNGTESVSGAIENCSGIALDEDAEISFGKNQKGEFRLTDGAMEWTGLFRPKSLQVEADCICEWYPSRQILNAGDVITIDLSSSEESYCKASASSSVRPLAVVSLNYSFCIGRKTGSSYPACSRGRASAKVKGQVVKGEMLVPSDTAGVLKAAGKEDSGREWAVALESSAAEGISLVRIHIL